jgi:hypothetical protein
LYVAVAAAVWLKRSFLFICAAKICSWSAIHVAEKLTNHNDILLMHCHVLMFLTRFRNWGVIRVMLNGHCWFRNQPQQKVYSLGFAKRSPSGQWHQNTILMSLFYTNIYRKVIMYTFMKMIFETNLLIWFSHF